jgi:proline iminopeptidase
LKGSRIFYPQEWEQFTALIPTEERSDMMKAYGTRIMNPDPAIHREAALKYVQYEGHLGSFFPETYEPGPEDVDFALTLARLELHYFQNNGFFEENQILRNISLIQHIPCTIIQGRYDMVCPPTSAFELHQKWTQSKLIMVPDGGHSAWDGGMTRALIQATKDLEDAFTTH